LRDAYVDGLTSCRYDGDPTVTDAIDGIRRWLDVFSEAVILAAEQARQSSPRSSISKPTGVDAWPNASWVSRCPDRPGLACGTPYAVRPAGLTGVFNRRVDNCESPVIRLLNQRVEYDSGLNADGVFDLMTERSSIMSTTTTNETKITADPALPTIVITRDFDAPRETVFAAHTDPDLVVQWLGPRRLTMRIERYDARTGGAYRYVHTDEDGSEYAFYGAFHEVRPDERIVWTFTFEGVPDGVSLDTATFEDLGNGRSRLTTVSVVDSMEARDGMVASGMEVGVVEGYERLDELLSTQSRFPRD